MVRKQKAKPTPEQILRQQLKTLKKFGFIDYDLRKKLTPYKKSKVKDLIKSDLVKPILNKPEHFVKRKYDNSTRLNWVNNDNVKFNKKFAIIQKFDDNEYIRLTNSELIRKANNKRVRIFSHKGINLYNEVLQAFEKPLRKHEYITLKLGKHSMFSLTFSTPQTLLNYLQNWTPKDIGANKDDLISEMSVVRYTLKPAKNWKQPSYHDQTDIEDEDLEE